MITTNDGGEDNKGNDSTLAVT